MTDAAYSGLVVREIRALLAAPSPLGLDALCDLGELAWLPCPPEASLRERQRAARREAIERICDESMGGNESAQMVWLTLLAADGLDAEGLA